MNFMNSVFCYKKSCPIDICQLHVNHSSFLERASSLTDGMYVRAISSKSLYGLLTYYFLGDVDVRKRMLLPHDVLTTSVPCSCHGKPIENGQAYICTVCLSILCQRYDKCPIHTLHSRVSFNKQSTPFPPPSLSPRGPASMSHSHIPHPPSGSDCSQSAGQVPPPAPPAAAATAGYGHSGTWRCSCSPCCYDEFPFHFPPRRDLERIIRAKVLQIVRERQLITHFLPQHNRRLVRPAP